MNYLSYLNWKIRHAIHKKLCPVPWVTRGMFLVELCMEHRVEVQHVAEIGVWKGHTSQVLLHFLPTIKSYHLVDPWCNYEDYERSGDAKANASLPDAIIGCTDRLEFFSRKLIWHKQFSHDAVKDIADKSLDLVFLDGNHGYEYIKSDIECWRPKVRLGGILAGHDLDWKDAPGVRKAVEETFGQDWHDGPDMVWWRVEK